MLFFLVWSSLTTVSKETKPTLYPRKDHLKFTAPSKPLHLSV